MKETGLTINRQTVTDIYHAVGYMLKPVWEVLKKKVMIGDSDVKAIMTDGYVAYKHLDAVDSRIEHLAYLAHIRTKFIDWIEVAPDGDAAEMIRDFNELFRMERRYRDRELTYEDIADARISPETMEVLRRIADRLTRLEKRKESRRSARGPSTI